MTDGAVLLHVPHTTAAVTINEGFDPDVAADVVDVLARLVPRDDGYAHLEGNSDSHAKSIMVGCSQLLGVAGGTPVLGAGSASSSASSTARGNGSCWCSAYEQRSHPTFRGWRTARNRR